ncbi:MAG: hypothetical protein ACJART_000152 [Maribacter sp.]|jgi:hypothetical protein
MTATKWSDSKFIFYVLQSDDRSCRQNELWLYLFCIKAMQLFSLAELTFIK